MTLYNNKYRSETTRLPSWDYSSPGYYFVTICVRHMRHLFGRVENDAMVLNYYGKIVFDEWERTFQIRSNVIWDEFVVMPNHFHAVVHIAGKPCNARTLLHGVRTGKWKSGVLGAIMGQFKQQVTKKIRRNGVPGFNWLNRFYDHIVRDEEDLNRIREYIRNNPAKWGRDKFYS